MLSSIQLATLYGGFLSKLGQPGFFTLLSCGVLLASLILCELLLASMKEIIGHNLITGRVLHTYFKCTDSAS